ncbi:hypothetical protein NFI96_008155, partial [Prochilodus magdalenae]
MHFSPFLYTHCFKIWFSAEENLNAEFIRTVMFLLVELLLGPPAVIWALHVMHHHRKSGGRISVISVFLLLSDLLELILSSAIIVFTLGGDYVISCNVIAGLLFVTRVCGHHLHQLVALESVLSLRYPAVTHIFSPLCSTVLCIVVVVLVTVLMVLGDVGWLMNMRLSLWPLSVLVVTSLFTCKAFSGPVLSSTNRNPGACVDIFPHPQISPIPFGEEQCWCNTECDQSRGLYTRNKPKDLEVLQRQGAMRSIQHWHFLQQYRNDRRRTGLALWHPHDPDIVLDLSPSPSSSDAGVKRNGGLGSDVIGPSGPGIDDVPTTSAIRVDKTSL